MIIEAEVLSCADVLAIREVLERAPFRDGAATAGAAARALKDNQQARGDDPEVIALGRRVRLALEGHPLVRRWARPVRWSNLIFSRYGAGQRYGLHTDNAVMHDEGGWPFRTDISFTIFLSDAEDYEGGGLLIDDPTGERAFRPAAGWAVFYPTGALHGVAPVTRGSRLACVGWMQSAIRREDQRELLHELERVREKAEPGQALLLDKAIGNLLRMWCEP